MEDEPLELEFEPDADIVAQRRRHSTSPRERRAFVAALAVSLAAHGVLLGAAAIVLLRHTDRPPTAGIVRGDQGGDAGTYFEAGPAIEPPPQSNSLPPIPAPPTVIPSVEPTVQTLAIDPNQDQGESFDQIESVPAAIEPAAFSGLADLVGASLPLPSAHPFGPPSRSGSPPPQLATAEVVHPPRVARGSGLGDTIGVRGDPRGLDSRGLPVPEYPRESRHRGEEGMVELDVEVLSSGEVGSVRIANSSGYPRLDDAAVTAARNALFEPATRDGHPTVTHLTIPYRFVLRQALRS